MKNTINVSNNVNLTLTTHRCLLFSNWYLQHSKFSHNDAKMVDI